jgi:uncharacterized protein YifE (UPF0438 family)
MKTVRKSNLKNFVAVTTGVRQPKSQKEKAVKKYPSKIIAKGGRMQWPIRNA